jgi:hypothetical protein
MRIPAHRFLLASCLALSCGAVYAGPGDYRFEAGLTYEHNEFDEINLVGIPEEDLSFTPPDIDSIRLRGEYFFQTVDTDDVPLAEAAYLGRVSSAHAAWDRVEIDGAGSFDLQQLGFDVYVPKTMFFVSAVGARFETVSIGPGGVEKDHDTDWGAAVGVTPFAGLRITTFFDDDGYDPNVAVKYVGKIRGSNYYSASISFIDPDVGDLSVRAGFEYYFDNSFSAGLAYDEGDERWTLSTEKFFQSRWSISGSLYQDDAGDGFRVAGKYRF